MKHLFSLILLISIFFINQNRKDKKSEFESQMTFNSNKLHAVIAETWNINN